MNNGFDPGMLQKLTEDPEFLGKIMGMASALSSSGMLQGMLGSLSGAGEPAAACEGCRLARREEGTERRAGAPPLAGRPLPCAEPRPAEGAIHNTQKDRIKLLEAMRPFVPEDKKEKLDFIIKMLGLMQVASELGFKNIL